MDPRQNGISNACVLLNDAQCTLAEQLLLLGKPCTAALGLQARTAVYATSDVNTCKKLRVHIEKHGSFFYSSYVPLTFGAVVLT